MIYFRTFLRSFMETIVIAFIVALLAWPARSEETVYTIPVTAEAATWELPEEFAGQMIALQNHSDVTIHYALGVADVSADSTSQAIVPGACQQIVPEGATDISVVSDEAPAILRVSMSPGGPCMEPSEDDL